MFAEPVTTDLLRFEAWSGDGMYSVSEIQVFAPEGTVTVTVAGVEDAEGGQLAGVLYEGVGISDPEERIISYPHELSGGREHGRGRRGPAGQGLRG